MNELANQILMISFIRLKLHRVTPTLETVIFITSSSLKGDLRRMRIDGS